MNTYSLISLSATSDVNISGKIVMLLVADNSAHTNISVDGTGDIAALIDGAGEVFSITAGGKAVVVSGDTAVDTGTADDENLYIFLHDANGDGDVADTNEVTLVGQTVLDFDLDTLTTDNFVIA
ncbi:hypothetical protein OAV52_03175 [Planktomarina temperata]|nr:hypothetical protein [Planktomarina temperata]